MFCSRLGDANRDCTRRSENVSGKALAVGSWQKLVSRKGANAQRRPTRNLTPWRESGCVWDRRLAPCRSLRNNFSLGRGSFQVRDLLRRNLLAEEDINFVE